MSLKMDSKRAQLVGFLLLDAFRGNQVFGKTSMLAHVLPPWVRVST
jgi:hypothetical protein